MKEKPSTGKLGIERLWRGFRVYGRRLLVERKTLHRQREIKSR